MVHLGLCPQNEDLPSQDGMVIYDRFVAPTRRWRKGNVSDQLVVSYFHSYSVPDL